MNQHGALDTETSIQVMELLKEVAKDRLVVMVTHNPELAENYATRIVNLKDGRICNDTNPYILGESQEKPIHKNMGKTSMSFLTSLFLSFNNLKTKKGRTILTSFAGSIGIIGIALILSLSNGVNSYIKTIEEDTLSEYPLQIQSTGFDFTSMLVDNNTEQKEERTGEDIKTINMLTNMFSKIGTNDLASLKKYLESDECDIDKYAKAVEYRYNILPQIYSSNTEDLRQVNPNTSFASLGMGSSVTSNSMMSNMMSTDVFYQMPSNTNLFKNQYDIKAGQWPTKYNECVLVLTSEGNISDFMLYTLGLKDYKELDTMINQFIKEEEVKVPDNKESYSYDDILNTTFKLINSSDCYEYDTEYNLWRNKSENKEYMKKIVENGEEIKIVGIAQPKEGATATMLRTGIYYPASLLNHVIEKASQSEMVKQQLNSPDINVLTGKRFDDTEKESDFQMSSLIEVDTNAIKSAFKIDESKIKVDLGNLNQVMGQASLPALDLNSILNQLHFSLSENEIQTLFNDLLTGYKIYVEKHPEADLNQISKNLTQYLQSKEASELLKKEIEEIIKENGNLTITQEQMQKIITNVLKGYNEYAEKNNLPNIEQFEKYITDYLQSEEAKQVISTSLLKIVKSQDLDKQISSIVETYMKNVMTTMGRNLQREIKTKMTSLSKSITNAFSIDGDAFVNAIHMKMNKEELAELMASLMSKEQTTYEGNLKKLGYANLEEPSEIDIFPKNFEGNKNVLAILDEYNIRMERANQGDKVISYTDMVGTLMSSVTTIVDVISYVLVAFVAISLIVSSIMIGVITYISVLERKKEIGILRAIGASKRNIAQVFNAETFMIGLLAGIIGISITLILLIPINQIIHSIAGQNNINASLPIIAGVILIALSVILTLVGGIIPSKKAAREDPVMALRSD